jgi:hypothetical protein
MEKMESETARLKRSPVERFSISRALRSPLIWLLVLMSVQWVILNREGRFKPKRVNDTQGYVGALQQETLRDILSGNRTVGYPLFLEVVGPLAPEFGAVPEAHTIVYFAAILVFWLAATSFTGSPWLGFAFAAPMVFANLFAIVRRVQPDFLSCALAVAALGFLVWAVACPRRKILVWAVAVFVFLAYQTRPAYLFMIPFVPFIGVLLWVCLRGWNWRQIARWTVGICLASALPFLLFSTLRWATVGHFGLVSFGGVNAIGIAVVLMDSEAVENLPPEVQPLGERIYRKVRMGKDRVRPYPPNLGGASYRYNRIVWNTSFPMAVEYLEDQARADSDATISEARSPANMVEVNKLLTDLSTAMFRLRPRRYLAWIATSAWRTTRRVIRDPWIRVPSLVLLVSLLGLSIRWLAYVFRRTDGRSTRSDPLRPGLRVALGLVLLGVGYYVCHILLIVAVEIPIPRYIVTTTPFLSGSVIGFLCALWRGMFIRESASWSL